MLRQGRPDVLVADVELGAETVDRGDDRDSDAARYQSVLDRRGRALVAKKSDRRFHAVILTAFLHVTTSQYEHRCDGSGIRADIQSSPELIFASGPSIPAFAKMPNETGCEYRNRTTRQSHG